MFGPTLLLFISLDLYRSAYVLAYLLSTVAVFIALGGVFAAHVDEKALVVVAEIIVKGSIIALILLGRHWRWHERWLDYRALAKSLRHGRFLAYLSEVGRAHDHLSSATARRSTWIVWYLRATMRELILPSAVLDGTYRWRILSATATNEIEKQIQYHEENRRTAHHIDHALHNVGLFCFLATFFVLALFLVGYGYERIFGEFGTGSAIQSQRWAVFHSSSNHGCLFVPLGCQHWEPRLREYEHTVILTALCNDPHK